MISRYYHMNSKYLQMALYLPILKWIEDMFDKFEDIKSIMDTYVIFEDIFYRIEDIFQWFEYIFNLVENNYI